MVSASSAALGAEPVAEQGPDADELRHRGGGGTGQSGSMTLRERGVGHGRVMTASSPTRAESSARSRSSRSSSVTRPGDPDATLGRPPED